MPVLIIGYNLPITTCYFFCSSKNSTSIAPSVSYVSTVSFGRLTSSGSTCCSMKSFSTLPEAISTVMDAARATFLPFSFSPMPKAITPILLPERGIPDPSIIARILSRISGVRLERSVFCMFAMSDGSRNPLPP